jgi:hypothetical protein
MDFSEELVFKGAQNTIEIYHSEGIYLRFGDLIFMAPATRNITTLEKGIPCRRPYSPLWILRAVQFMSFPGRPIIFTSFFRCEQSCCKTEE